MKKLLLVIISLLALTAQAQIHQRIIIKLKPGITSQKEAVEKGGVGIAGLDSIHSIYKASSIKKLNSGKRDFELFVISFPNDADTATILRSYTATGLIEYAEPDFTGEGGGKKAMSAPDDEFYFRQWGLYNNGSFNMMAAVAGADIQMEDAWEIEEGNEDIVVAVMDSGLRLTHPEFEGRIWSNTSETPDNGIDDDANGYIDDVYGWDFVNEDNDPSDDLGHGTNVTGIIGANGDNGIGYSGVDKHCKIMTLKGLNEENIGSYSWWHDAIVYAVDHGANVINLSVGGNSFSTTLKGAIDYALDNNVVVVACMMNADSDEIFYPAKFDGVIAVGSTDPDDNRTSPFFWDPNSGSNFGPHISVVAPGNFIYGLDSFSDDYYDSYWGGTSQATPLVSGLASLLLAQDMSRTPAEIKALIEETAEDQVGSMVQDLAGFDNYYGHGRINAFNALSAALSTEKHTVDNAVVAHPNPTTGQIYIKSRRYPLQLQVSNALGQKLFEQEVTSADSPINIDSSGIYFLTLNIGEAVTTKKIIVE